MTITKNQIQGIVRNVIKENLSERASYDNDLKFLAENVKNMICEELDKKDVIEIAKKDKDFEKRIKAIVSDVVVDMFRVLWQHHSIFKSLGK